MAMEAVLLQRPSPDQTLSPYKQIRNPRKINRPYVSRRSENFPPPNFQGGLVHAPPPSPYFSYPPSISIVNSQQQPPLLPLPITKTNNNPQSRGLPCPPVDRKIKNRGRDQSLTPKKSKSVVSPRKADSEKDLKKIRTKASSEWLIIGSTNPFGPDPKDIPKDVSRVLSSSAGNNYSDLEKFSGSVAFTLSPPPSSLPLPTFSLRPKLSCSVEAGGVDAGATDNLRRLLRLR